MCTRKLVSTATTAPVERGNLAGSTPEFGRVADVQKLYGIKRGSLYSLLADGKIKGVLLRVRGQKSGIRLIDLASVGAFIRAQMESEEQGREA